MRADEIGNTIYKHRKIAGLNRIELAELAGVGKTVIYDLEHGKTTVKMDTLLKVLQSLNIKFELVSPLLKTPGVRDSQDA
jgi:HTH-type transcriptional regulator / antitoxin HipB